jgi:polygalacturonase
MKRYLKIIGFCFFNTLIICSAATGLALDKNQRGEIRNLEAPKLGITATSAILTWYDTFIPDYQSDDLKQYTRKYNVYKNGVQIGTTNHKAYSIQGLNPATNYKLSVRLDGDSADLNEIFIDVSTKIQGKIFNAKKYGAKGDGIHNDTEFIQKTIDACSAGGTVFIPAGHYLVGHLKLKSEITLEIGKDACLTFFGYKEGTNYPKLKTMLQGPDGEITYESLALISGINVHDVVITGEGVIDGQGETWWPHYSETKRPFTIEFVSSSNILVQGITIQDPPFWNNHLLYVDHAVYSNVKFFKVSQVSGHNGDGLNPDASRDILVVGCLFGNQDDCIAIKSGKYVNDGNKRRRSCEYITIRDCVFDGNAAPGSGPLGIAIGSESSGGVKHILVKDCEFSNIASLANIKTNRERFYAYVEDVRFENITYTNTTHVDRWWNRAPVSVDHFYTDAPGSNPSIPELFTSRTPVFTNIHFWNISIYNPVGRGIYISGLAESPIHNIDFDRVYVRSRDGVTIQNVDLLSIRGITVLPVGGE